jgi:hypothetical protein
VTVPSTEYLVASERQGREGVASCTTSGVSSDDCLEMHTSGADARISAISNRRLEALRHPESKYGALPAAGLRPGLDGRRRPSPHNPAPTRRPSPHIQSDYSILPTTLNFLVLPSGKRNS